MGRTCPILSMPVKTVYSGLAQGASDMMDSLVLLMMEYPLSDLCRDVYGLLAPVQSGIQERFAGCLSRSKYPTPHEASCNTKA